MLNVVVREKGYPAAVLIRGVEGAAGPGRVTRRLKIIGLLNGKHASQKTGLWFEDRDTSPVRQKIMKTSRVGVSYAGPVWSKKKYRFVLHD